MYVSDSYVNESVEISEMLASVRFELLGTAYKHHKDGHPHRPHLCSLLQATCFQLMRYACNWPSKVGNDHQTLYATHARSFTQTQCVGYMLSRALADMQFSISAIQTAATTQDPIENITVCTCDALMSYGIMHTHNCTCRVIQDWQHFRSTSTLGCLQKTTLYIRMCVDTKLCTACIHYC